MTNEMRTRCSLHHDRHLRSPLACLVPATKLTDCAPFLWRNPIYQRGKVNIGTICSGAGSQCTAHAPQQTVKQQRWRMGTLSLKPMVMPQRREWLRAGILRLVMRVIVLRSPFTAFGFAGFAMHATAPNSKALSNSPDYRTEKTSRREFRGSLDCVSSNPKTPNAKPLCLGMSTSEKPQLANSRCPAAIFRRRSCASIPSPAVISR
jgi:hypothetical protein